MRRQRKIERRRYLTAAGIAGLAIALVLVLASAASAVSWNFAFNTAVSTQRHYCGLGFWWSCEDYTAPAPYCRRGSNPPGAWSCSGGVTEHGFFRYRNCYVNTYVSARGASWSGGRFHCS